MVGTQTRRAPGSDAVRSSSTAVEDVWAFRPLTVARVGDAIIEILLDTREEWAERFVDGDPVHVTYSDTRANDWADLHGSATISEDPTLIDELWNPFAGAYFDDGRNTPGIAVLRITVDSGRYWSTRSGRIGSLISMITAAVGHPHQSTEHGTIQT